MKTFAVGDIQYVEIESYDEFQQFAAEAKEHAKQNPLCFNKFLPPKELLSRRLNYVIRYAGIAINFVLTYDDSDRQWHLSLSTQGRGKLSDELSLQIVSLILPKWKEHKSPFNSPVRHFTYVEE